MTPALLAGLAWSSLRRRPGTALPAAVVVAAAAMTLSVAAGSTRSAERPWQRTFDAVRGAHVAVQADPGSAGVLEAAARQPGVVAAGGPRPFRIVEAPSVGLVRVLAGDRGSPVDRLLVVAGAAPGRGDLVLERSFARAEGLDVGDRLRAGGRDWRISGLGVSATQGRYPQHQPGLTWAREADLAGLTPAAPGAGAPPGTPIGGPVPSATGIEMGLRLRDPARAEEVARRLELQTGSMVRTWRQARADALEDAPPLAIVFGTFGLVALAAAASVVTLVVTARVLESRRALGTVRAMGATPRQAAALVVLEHLFVAGPAVVLGIAGGAVLSPVLTRPTAALLAAPAGPAFVPAAAAAILVGALLVTAAAASFASRRVVRAPTVDALRGSDPAPARVRGPGVVTRLPVVLGLAARDLAARPLRSALGAGGLALAAAMGVAALAMEATFALDGDDAAAREAAAAIRPVVYPLEALLLGLGLLTLLATALVGLRERRRQAGVLAALGSTPGQTAAATVAGAALSGVLAGAAGAPLGLLIFSGAYRVAEASADHALPPAWQLVLIVPVTALLAAAAGAAAARIARGPVPAAALRAD